MIHPHTLYQSSIIVVSKEMKEVLTGKQRKALRGQAHRAYENGV
jgi:hypothetical protein